MSKWLDKWAISIAMAVVTAAAIACIVFLLIQSRTRNTGVSIMGLQPIGDKIIVQREEKKDRTEGGIILPDSAKEKPARGKVVAVGPGAWNSTGTGRIALTVKVGDTVLFSKWSGSEHEHKTMGDLVILTESDILCIEE